MTYKWIRTPSFSKLIFTISLLTSQQVNAGASTPDSITDTYDNYNPMVSVVIDGNTMSKPLRNLKGTEYQTYRAQKFEQESANTLSKKWTSAMDESHAERIKWWQDARFGAFVHWGVYSDLAGYYKGKKYSGYSEHIQRKAKINQKDYYNDVIKSFNPTEFNADEWVKLLSEAGMKYFIITAKHHDGFAMYPSKVHDYTLAKQTVFKRDPMVELATACKKYGMKFGFYYSQAFDWGEEYGSGNDWEFDRPGGDRKLYGDTDFWMYNPEVSQEIREKYVDTKSIPQILELIDMYQPDMMWFDTEHKISMVDNLRILDAMRSAGFNGLINSRLTPARSDYQSTGDMAVYFRNMPYDNWEAIPTTNNSYGYSSHDKEYKDPDQIIRNVISAASFGGNTLMNVGPMGNGKIGLEDTAILKQLATWFSLYGDSFYGTTKNGLPLQDWGVLTKKQSKISTTNSKLFLHVFDWPATSSSSAELVLGGIKGQLKSAKLLTAAGKQTVQFEHINHQDIKFVLKGNAPHTASSVIELEFEGQATAGQSARLIDFSTPSNLLTLQSSISDGMKYQQGTLSRYGVTGWDKNDEKVQWSVRNHKPATVNIELRSHSTKFTRNGDLYWNYQAPAGNFAADPTKPTVQLYVDNKLVNEFVTNADAKATFNHSLGQLTLTTGEHTIELRAKHFNGRETIRPAELIFTPVK